MTSAPKPERMTAALGPAMKLARSTTFRPEKILSFAIAVASEIVCGGLSLASLESGGALFQEGGGTLFLVFRRRADRQERSLEQQSRGVARLHSLVDCLERKAH